jgi:hypothetical protein
MTGHRKNMCIRIFHLADCFRKKTEMEKTHIAKSDRKRDPLLRRKKAALFFFSAALETVKIERQS